MSEVNNFNDGIMDKAMEIFKRMKALGIVASILMIILGACLFINPISTSSFFIWLVVAGVLINGIEKIVAYCKTPKECRDGFLLASGILWLLISVLLILDGFHIGFTATAGTIDMFIAVMIGITCLFSGIGRIATSSNVAKMGGSATGSIVSGILEIICALLVISAPLFSFFAIVIAFGLYLTIMGIALLIRCVTI